VREIRTLGSARGAARKGGPYRDRCVLSHRTPRPATTHQRLPGALDPPEIQRLAGFKKAKACWKGITTRYPRMLAHWQWTRAFW
jgi:hypothetical protein